MNLNNTASISIQINSNSKLLKTIIPTQSIIYIINYIIILYYIVTHCYASVYCESAFPYFSALQVYLYKETLPFTLLNESVVVHGKVQMYRYSKSYYDIYTVEIKDA